MRAPASLQAVLGLACVLPLALRAQSTWLGTTNNGYNTAANWSPASVPGAGADLIFTATAGQTSIGINTAASVNSLTFSGSFPSYQFNNGGGSLTIGAGGVTVGSGATNALISFNNGLNPVLSANQTWSTSSSNGNMSVSGNISGAFTLTKAGTGYLTLGGSNTFSGLTISGGTVYLTQNTSGGSGTIAVQSGGTLGMQSGDISLSNALSLASGATLGGTLNSGSAKLTVSGTATLGSSTTTLNLNSGDVEFTGNVTGPSNTALTVHSGGTGAAIFDGTTSNLSSVTADSAATVFKSSATFPSTAIAATNGGYVSVSGADTTTTNTFLGLITDKANFNGIIGFDTDKNASTPTIYSSNIDLTGFTSGNVRLGSASFGVLTGTITPAGQSYDFGGFAGQTGFLAVQSALADHGGTTGVSVLTPSASGGIGQNGLAVILQGNNTFTGNLSVTYSGVILDSANALPSGSTFSMGNNAYVGYTEAATGFATFASFAAKATSYTSTSVLGIDSHDPIAYQINGSGSTTTRTLSDATIDLSTFNPVFLGTITGATINSSQIIAPSSDHTLRLVNLSDFGTFTINTSIADADAHALVAGLPGAEGMVVLNGTNTYTGGTTLQGGGLTAGNANALGTGAITVGATTGNNSVLAAGTSGLTIANDIAVTDFLNIGTGTVNSSNNNVFNADTNALTLSGTISNVSGHTGRLYLTTPTTITGTNTYSGGTYVEANTTVSTNGGLGTGFVDIGYGATLTLTSSHPSIGSLSNAGSFIPGAGTGALSLGSSVVDLTINQTSNLVFSGAITTASSATTLIKSGSGQLTLAGANASTFTGNVSLTAGTLSIGDSNTTTTTFASPVATSSGTTLVFRPAASTTLSYGAAITGAGTVNVNGNGSGIVSITAPVGNFTGPSNVSTGTLQLNADNAWSNASTLTLNGGTNLQVNGNQTIQNLTSNGGGVAIANGKTLTVNSAAGSTISGAISGTGGALVKSGSGTLTLTGTNTYTGGTSITAGTLQLGSGGSNGTLTGTIDVSSGATLQLNHSTTNTVSNTITGAGGVSNTSGTTTLSGTNTYTGGTTITGSTVSISNNANLGSSGGITFNSGAGTPTLKITSGLGTVNRNVTLNGAGTIDATGTTTLSGAVNGTANLTKAGAGTLVLTGNSSSFTGSTLVTAGVFNVDGNLSSSSATVSGTAKLYGSSSINNVSVAAGTHLGAVTAANVPATFTTGNVTFNTGGVLDLFFTNATAGAGTGYSFLNVGGTLSLASMTVKLMSYNSGSPGLASNFDPTQNYSFTLATSNSLSGFNAGSVVLDTSGFQNSFAGSWAFALSPDTKSLLLNYSGAVAVPEPAVSALLAGLGACGFVLWRRRARKTS